MHLQRFQEHIEWSSSVRHPLGVVLLLTISALLNACGGGASEATSGGTVTAVCINGSAPVDLTWDAVPGASGYRVYVGTTNGFYPQVVDAGLNTTTTITTGLSSGTTYYFVATAYDGSTPPNESSFSNVACKTIS